MVKALHIFAGVAVLGGIYQASQNTGELKELFMVKYLLWAILFEVAALNVKS